MDGLATWIAPAATMIAAMMTAANLGARITGWGFVVFTLGSVCWVLVGLQSDQPALIATNIFLTLVNLAGIWRWLGRQAHYEALASAAEDAGQSPVAPSVIPATALAGRKLVDPAGNPAGEVVDAIIACRTGAIAYLVVRCGGVGGVGERVVALERRDVTLAPETIRAHRSAAQVAALPELDEATWHRLLETHPAGQ